MSGCELAHDQCRSLIVDEGTPINLSIDAQDPDAPTNGLTYALESGPNGMSIDPATGALSWTPTEDDGPGSYPISVTVTDDNPVAVNDTQFNTTHSFNLEVAEVNRMPALQDVSAQTIDEGELLTLTVLGSDPDLPANMLTYTLVSGPTGASIDPSSGEFSWRPTEDLGGETVLFAVQVSDNGGQTASTQFPVTVFETNVAPVIANEMTRLSWQEEATSTLQITARDADLPANSLTFQLGDAPVGMSISPAGVITWTPSEMQGGDTYDVTVTVLDDGDPVLSATQMISITVDEVNRAPSITAIEDQAHPPGELFQLQVQSTDNDLPADELDYVLTAAPEGMTVSDEGLLTWMPGEDLLGNSVLVIVSVTDNGEPSMSASQQFTIRGLVNGAPEITPIEDVIHTAGSPLSLQVNATDTDEPANALLYSLTAAPGGMEISTTGLITWTPDASLANTSLAVTVQVTDDGNPPARASSSFQLTLVEPEEEPVRLDITQKAPKKLSLISVGPEGQTLVLETSLDLRDWTAFTQFTLGASPMIFEIDRPDDQARYYRLMKE